MRNAVSSTTLGGVLLTILCLSIGVPAHGQQTFMETCLGSIVKFAAPITCTTQYGGLRLSMQNQKLILQSVTADGSTIVKTLAVQKAQHLPPRLEDVGYIDESVRFVAQGEGKTMTLAFQCGESQYAYIGAARGDNLPSESIAECH